MAMTQEQLEQLLAAPALEASDGVTPEFENPPNGNVLAWAVTTFCMVVTTLCLFIRAYGRIWLERKFTIEEAYWGTAYAAYALIWTPGYYVHTWNLRMGDLVKPLWLILIYGCCYSAVLPCIKTAILLDWCRVFVPGRKTRSSFWWACMFVIFIQCAWGVACIILLNLQCRPHNAIWEFWVPSKCYKLPKVMLGSASIQVICDVAMALLPQHIIWGLKMNWQRKAGIALIFGVGVIACVAACFRLAHTVTFSKEADTMWYIGPLLFWACAEMTCGFFILSVTCIPRIVAESGFSAKVKRALGISVKSSNPPNENSDFGPRSGSNQPAKSGKSSDNYYKLDEDGVPMTNFDRSESQEHLREEERTHERKATVHVTRTTIVTSNSNASSHVSIPNLTPWESQKKQGL
ncbi:hypothetical protein EDB81DRAFT_651229 [Dactylonectria macrodidyma]|uniref:Rhodopsin domain-containing protein n=1 Tax=Dactylonectria macrodidyma TaxID=307937 RepID=A0A9P9EVL8_9HYPO|nr:hypothetical protein EDB81DRAFT_651229 [Dactylonectria macrodidyma]